MFPVTFILVLMTFRNMAFLMAVATAMVAKAQTERKMTVDDLFQLVESNSKTLRQEKISVEFAKKGIEAARSARLPELTASASVSMNGDVVMMDRDFTNAHGFAAPRWGNSLALEAQLLHSLSRGSVCNSFLSFSQMTGLCVVPTWASTLNTSPRRADSATAAISTPFFAS